MIYFIFAVAILPSNILYVYMFMNKIYKKQNTHIRNNYSEKTQPLYAAKKVDRERGQIIITRFIKKVTTDIKRK